MRRLLALALASGLFLATALSAHAQGTGDAESDDPTGLSALRQLADAQGHHSGLITNQFQLPTAGTLVIVEPETSLTTAEADRVAAWVERGGVLVYAAVNPDTELDSALRLVRSDSVGSGRPDAVIALPLLGGVHKVRLVESTPFGTPTTDQVAILRSAEGTQVLGIAVSRGAGRVFALSSSLPLTNAFLGSEDNGLLAADLLAAAGPGTAVAFDQYHHGGGAGQSSSLAWIATPWGLAIVLEVLLVFLALMLRGRTFGPLIPLRASGDPSSAEFTSAVGAMMRRARARNEAMERVLAATRQAVAEQAGVRGASDLEAVLERRAPALAAGLHDATKSAAAVTDEASFARAAAELHALAHPAPSAQPSTTGRR